MANQKHLDVLKQGVEVWNEWRKEYDKIRARDDEKKEDPEAERISLEVLYGKRPWKDFFKNVNTPDLSGADLSHTDLSYANFRRTNFNGANLRNATLNGVDFRKSLLCGANFQNADLADANLSGSFLIATDFSRADLGFANFSQAFFSFTNLSNSILFSTMFGDVDLRDSYGLETVEHVGPSIISIDTLVQSQGDIPETFLRGVGCPDTFIDYARSLIAKPIDYYTCFIAHSSKDRAFVQRLYSDLQDKGVRCWYAPEDLKIGDKFWYRIDESIRLHDKLLIILSKNSIASPWVESEVIAAVEKEHQQNKIVLFPIKLDESVMRTGSPWAADMRRARHIGDFRKWKYQGDYQKAFERLLHDLKAEG